MQVRANQGRIQDRKPKREDDEKIVHKEGALRTDDICRVALVSCASVSNLGFGGQISPVTLMCLCLVGQRSSWSLGQAVEEAGAQLLAGHFKRVEGTRRDT